MIVRQYRKQEVNSKLFSTLIGCNVDIAGQPLASILESEFKETLALLLKKQKEAVKRSSVVMVFFNVELPNAEGYQEHSEEYLSTLSAILKENYTKYENEILLFRSYQEGTLSLSFAFIPIEDGKIGVTRLLARENLKTLNEVIDTKLSEKLSWYEGGISPAIK